MILNALVERLKRRFKGDFKGRHYKATLMKRCGVRNSRILHNALDREIARAYVVQIICAKQESIPMPVWGFRAGSRRSMLSG